jgi:hypothetical protein
VKSLLIALTATFALGCATTAPRANTPADDIPKNGDNMLVLVVADVAVVLDKDRQINEADGSRSAILLIVFPAAAKDGTGAVAGRVYLKCEARTVRFGATYKLDAKDAHVLGIQEPATSSFEPVAPDSVATLVANDVCGVVPSLPHSGKPPAPARGQQITEL